jgi:hypothetical protein
VVSTVRGVLGERARDKLIWMAARNTEISGCTYAKIMPQALEFQVDAGTRQRMQALRVAINWMLVGRSIKNASSASPPPGS